jgi:monoterpene epsilon-lactone hydrolase
MPVASAELQTVLKMLAERQAAQAEGPPPDLAATRAGMEERAFPPTEAATIAAVDAHGVPCEWITTPASDPRHRLLYFHGGGYVIGSAKTHRRLCENLAQATGCAVLNVDYRLAPEHPFPAAVDDGLATLRFIREQGPEGPGAAAALFVAGDSAGGGLVLATLLAAKRDGVRLPDGAIGISAWTDLAGTGASIASRRAKDPLIRDPGMLTGMASQYLGDADARDPLASPLYGDLAGLPPLLLQVGDCEILLDDTTRVAAKAREAGVAVEEEVWPEMFHVWHSMAPILPEGQQAIDRIGRFVREHIPARA